MMRTQIQFTEDQHRRLKRWAHERGISLSEAVRRCVESHLAVESRTRDREGRIREAVAVFGKYADDSAPSRVAIDHDEHLPEAFGG